MPNVNASVEHFNRISNGQALIQRQQSGPIDKQQAQTIRQALSQRNRDTQYATDAAFWYGAVTSVHAKAWKKDLVRRIFSLLHFGGLMYKPNGGGAWTAWSGTGWPIAVALSHSARVMIQIEPGVPGQNLWTWLWGTHAAKTRSAATHGVVPMTDETVVNNRVKVYNEVKTDNMTQHGVNIGLGGVGQVNPHSGNTIAENGEHGHLYLGYRAPTNSKAGALLVGCEPSAPADAWKGHSKTGIGMVWNAVIVGVPDQQGEGHGIGGGQDYTGTGGMRWDRGIFQNDNARPRYYNGMFVDLSEPGDCLPFVNGTNVFNDDFLGTDGLAVPPSQFPRAVKLVGGSLTALIRDDHF